MKRPAADPIVAAIGPGRDALAADLRQLVENYKAHVAARAESLRLRSPRPAPAATRAALRRIRRAAAELRSALDAAPERVRVAVLDSAVRRVNESHFGDWRAGDLLEAHLYELQAVATEREGQSATERERPGPKADPLRLALAVWVASVLKMHGCRPSTYESGTFAKALRAVAEAASGSKLADDLRPLLREALRVCTR